MMANTILPISQLSVRTNSSNRVHLDALCCRGLRLVDVRCGFCPHLGDGSFSCVEIGHRGVNEGVKCNKRCAAECKNENPQMPKGALNKRLSRICQSFLIVVYRLASICDAENVKIAYIIDVQIIVRDMKCVGDILGTDFCWPKEKKIKYKITFYPISEVMFPKDMKDKCNPRKRSIIGV